MVKLLTPSLIIAALALPVLLTACASSPPPTPDWELEGWDLVWHDEFDGSELDRESWTFDLGGGGWGNAESQVYTDRPENVRLEDGVLVIEAREEEYRGADYTSARLKTQGLNAWEYGRIEARMKLPVGRGIWPAFWMLGEDITTRDWPACGEIDIMEYLGHDTDTVYGTLHGPGYSGDDGIDIAYSLPDDGRFTDDFHVFRVEWIPGKIEWYVDDTLFQTLTIDDVPGEWVYDQPFFILLNLAVGGEWPGYPTAGTEFPQQLLVDYVRVYQKDAYEGATVITPTPEPVQMRISELTLTPQGSAAASSVTVLDDDDNPVSGVTVKATWMGAVSGGDDTLITGENGVAGPFQSDTAAEAGTITFCVTRIEKQGYIYNTMRSVDTCASTTP